LGVGRGGTTPPQKIPHVQKTSEMPRMGSINRRPGCKEKKLIFGTWNVRTLYKTGALLSLLSQLKEYRLAITALQETRWQAKDIMDMKSHTLFYSGKEGETREFGMAFVVERNMKLYVLDFKAVDEQMCVLRIKTKFQNSSLINVHAPTEEKEDLEKEAFYQKVEEVYDSCPSNDIKIVWGDWNAKVGREEIYQGIIGKHSMHINTNNNGQRFLQQLKIWWYPQPVFHTKKYINKLGDLQMEKLITKSITY